MNIKSFALSEIGPFDDITFNFDDRVNVFVGENNTGKSCALVCLGEVCVYPFGMPGKFFRADRKAKFKIGFGHGKRRGRPMYSGDLPIKMDIGTSGFKELHRYTSLLKELGYTAFVPALRWGTEFRATGPTTAAQKAKLEEKNSG
jgi:hypothetical protein